MLFLVKRRRGWNRVRYRLVSVDKQISHLSLSPALSTLIPYARFLQFSGYSSYFARFSVLEYKNFQTRWENYNNCLLLWTNKNRWLFIHPVDIYQAPTKLLSARPCARPTSYKEEPTVWWDQTHSDLFSSFPDLKSCSLEIKLKYPPLKMGILTHLFT